MFKEKVGNHDKFHYLSKYLEEKKDTIILLYSFDLCLCPKWYLKDTGNPVWIELNNDYDYINTSRRESNGKVMRIIGTFYKYKGIPSSIYDYRYLSE